MKQLEIVFDVSRLWGVRCCVLKKKNMSYANCSLLAAGESTLFFQAAPEAPPGTASFPFLGLRDSLEGYDTRGSPRRWFRIAFVSAFCLHVASRQRQCEVPASRNALFFLISQLDVNTRFLLCIWCSRCPLDHRHFSTKTYLVRIVRIENLIVCSVEGLPYSIFFRLHTPTFRQVPGNEVKFLLEFTKEEDPDNVCTVVVILDIAFNKPPVYIADEGLAAAGSENIKAANSLLKNFDDTIRHIFLFFRQDNRVSNLLRTWESTIKKATLA
eukprot:284815397_4